MKRAPSHESSDDHKRQCRDKMRSDSLNFVQTEYSAWLKNYSHAEEMVPLLGQMYRKKNVVCTLFAKRLNNKNASQILQAHAWARVNRASSDIPVTVFETHAVLLSLANLITRQVPGVSEVLQTLRIDLGKCVLMCSSIFKSETSVDNMIVDLEETLRKALLDKKSIVGGGNPMVKARDIVLYGFGRIGRLIMRILIEKAGGGVKLMLRAIVVRKKKIPDLLKRASLLLRDSVHGPFEGTVTINEEKNAIIANGVCVRLIYASSPDEVDYTSYGINNAIVVDNTGMYVLYFFI